MFAWTVIVMGLTGGDVDVTKIPAEERIAYANNLANRYKGRNAWDDRTSPMETTTPRDHNVGRRRRLENQPLPGSAGTRV